MKNPLKREGKSFRNNYLALLISLFFSLGANAQWLKPNNAYGTISNGQEIGRILLFPTGCGAPALPNSADSARMKFAIYGDSCNNLLYLYDPKLKTWGTIKGGGLDNVFISSSATTDTFKFVKDGVETIIGIIDTKDGLISGGVVTQSSSPLVFDVTPAIYKVNATRYNSAAGSVTLPTGGDLDIIYGIGVDTLQQIIVIAGEPSENPKDPQIDPSLGIILTKVRVNAHATTPAGISQVLVYDENTETWTHTTTFTANFDNTVNPFHLTKSIDVSAGSTGSYIEFVNATVLNSVDYTALKMYVRLKNALVRRTNLSVQFYNGSTAVSSSIQLGSANGFDPNITGAYQNVSIPLSGFTSSSFDRIRITFTGPIFPGFYLDYITLQAGITNTGGGGTSVAGVQDVYAKGDSILKVINGQTSLVKDLTYTNYAKDPIYFDGDTAKLKANIITQGDNVTITGTGTSTDPYVINSTGGGGGTGSGISQVVADYGLLNVNDSTLKADSLLLSTKAWRQKGIDSVQANINVNTTAISGKQNTLPTGSDGQILSTSGGIPVWKDTVPLLDFNFTSIKDNDYIKYDSANNRWVNFTPKADTSALFVFGGGGANAGDTATFTTSTIYGAVYNSTSDTMIITMMQIALQGTSPSVVTRVYWNDSLNVTAGATSLTTSGTTVTNTYTGTTVTSFANTKIPPGVWVWCKTTTVTTKPTFLSVTLIGYKKQRL